MGTRRIELGGGLEDEWSAAVFAANGSRQVVDRQVTQTIRFPDCLHPGRVAFKIGFERVYRGAKSLFGSGRRVLAGGRLCGPL